MINACLLTLADNKYFIILAIISLCILAAIGINATYKKHRKEFEENR